ncbi:vanillate porin OpdK [Pseudomonas aeruginosa]|nr:vanillate porin OpdK [Pseudomonas aeruginosa]
MKIRRKTAVPRNAGAVLPMLACLAAQAAEGGFLEDAKTDLVLRNYYFNRDFRDHDAGKSLVDEWAQGFILKVQFRLYPGHGRRRPRRHRPVRREAEQRTWHQQFRASSVAR